MMVDKLVGSMVEEMAQAIRTAYLELRWKGNHNCYAYIPLEAGMSEVLAQACAAIAQKRVNELEAERSFVWKWIERALFDKALSKDECLSTLAGYPGAPWMNGRWDVDHKPYAAQFYKRFPRAALPTMLKGNGDG